MQELMTISTPTCWLSLIPTLNAASPGSLKTPSRAGPPDPFRMSIWSSWSPAQLFIELSTIRRGRREELVRFSSHNDPSRETSNLMKPVESKNIVCNAVLICKH